MCTNTLANHCKKTHETFIGLGPGVNNTLKIPFRHFDERENVENSSDREIKRDRFFSSMKHQFPDFFSS